MRCKGKYSLRYLVRFELLAPFEIREQIAALLEHHFRKKKSPYWVEKVEFEQDDIYIWVSSRPDVRPLTIIRNLKAFITLHFKEWFQSGDLAWGATTYRHKVLKLHPRATPYVIKTLSGGDV